MHGDQSLALGGNGMALQPHKTVGGLYYEKNVFAPLSCKVF